MGIGVVVFVFPCLLLLVLQVVPSAVSQDNSRMKCPDKCGEFDIPYPFGIGRDCARDESFSIICNNTVGNTSRPFWRDMEVSRIPPAVQGEIIVFLDTYRTCYNKTTNKVTTVGTPTNLSDSSFSFSSGNRYVVTGCATTGYMTDSTGDIFTGACTSVCNKPSSIPNNTCNGIGCCENFIMDGLQYFDVDFDTYYSRTNVGDFNPCSYAFLVKDGTFDFNLSIITADQNFTMKLPVVIHWAIQNPNGLDQNCETAKNLTSYACVSQKSICINTTNDLGYLCNCLEGYTGNPYIKDGCQEHLCTEGLMEGNASTSYGCIPIPNSKSNLIIGLAVGLGGGLFVLLSTGGSLWIYKTAKKLKKKKLKERYTKQNYELLLKQPISSEDVVKTKMFSLKELEKATNNFDSRRIIGAGGHGTVYKGLLLDQRVVAIKKSKKTDQKEIEEYINEVALLSRIHHKNVVELIGCSLESDVPLLVYEFIGNGTLSRHLYIWNRDSYLSWDDRLRIATEVAGAIAYLHSACSRTIFHRDLKSANILLDEKLTAKVADFGASKTLISEEAYITTAVQGTVGYLDPEYYGTGQLTEKSDVYSIGVILVELLTGQKIVSEARPQEQQNLAPYFIRLLKQDQIFEIIEGPILKEAAKEELESVAWLAESCLRLKGEERPTMKKVEETLGGLRMSRKKKKPRTDHEDFESFLSYDIPEVGSSQSTNTQQNLQAPFLPAQSFIC